VVISDSHKPETRYIQKVEVTRPIFLDEYMVTLAVSREVPIAAVDFVPDNVRYKKRYTYEDEEYLIDLTEVTEDWGKSCAPATEAVRGPPSIREDV